MLYTVLHYGNKEEKLSAFLDTGQRNKGEKKTNKRREEKRNLTLIVHMTMEKVTLFLKIFYGFQNFFRNKEKFTSLLAC